MHLLGSILLAVNFVYCTAYRTPVNQISNINENENLSYKNLRLVYSWKSLDFVFPDAWTREQAIMNKDFIPGAPFPIDVDASASKLNFYLFTYKSKFIKIKRKKNTKLQI